MAKPVIKIKLEGDLIGPNADRALTHQPHDEFTESNRRKLPAQYNYKQVIVKIDSNRKKKCYFAKPDSKKFNKIHDEVETLHKQGILQSHDFKDWKIMKDLVPVGKELMHHRIIWNDVFEDVKPKIVSIERQCPDRDSNNVMKLLPLVAIVGKGNLRDYLCYD